MPNDFEHRSIELERLDRGDYTPLEYARWQQEMFFIHRLLGEQRALFRAIEPNTTDRLSILEIGAGSGDLLRSVKRRARNDNNILIGSDGSFDAVKSIHANGCEAVQCNGLQLPFADNTFDVVYSSLTLHHFADAAAVILLKEMQRVASKRVIVIDLRRSRLAYRLYRIFGKLLLQPFTYEDGSLSIKRSFTQNELVSLAEKAGFSSVEVFRSAAFRIVMRGI